MIVVSAVDANAGTAIAAHTRNAIIKVIITSYLLCCCSSGIHIKALPINCAYYFYCICFPFCYLMRACDKQIRCPVTAPGVDHRTALP